MAIVAQGVFANISGVATVQTVSTRNSVLFRLIISNTDAAAQTVLVADDTTEIVTLTLQPNENGTFEFNCQCPNGIKITPSDADLNIAVVYAEA